MKEFTVYDSITGEIQYSGICQDDQFLAQAIEATHVVVEGIFDPNNVIFFKGKPIDKPVVKPPKEELQLQAKLYINNEARLAICKEYSVEKQLSLLMQAMLQVVSKPTPELETIFTKFADIQAIVDKSNTATAIASLDNITDKVSLDKAITSFKQTLGK